MIEFLRHKVGIQALLKTVFGLPFVTTSTKHLLDQLQVGLFF
jgi:hypothetical protein